MNTSVPGGSRRLHDRAPVGGRAGRLQIWSGTGWRSLEGIVADVSLGGCGLLVDRQLPPGTWVRVSLAGVLDGAPRSVRDGRVVYAVPRALPASIGAAGPSEATSTGAGASPAGLSKEAAPAVGSATDAGEAASAGTLGDGASVPGEAAGSVAVPGPVVPAVRQFPWRAGVAFRPVPPSAPGLLATRLLCAGILILLWTGVGLQEGGIVSGAGVLLPFSMIVGGLWLGAEVYSRSERRKYRRAHEAWLSSWAWYDAGSPAEAPPP